jgi:F0F1-type ATP synthase membrane subunit b/b'
MPVILAVACLGLAIALTVVLFLNRNLKGLLQRRELELAGARQEADRIRRHCDDQIVRIQRDAEASLAEAQKLVDQQVGELKGETERIRQHYEAEARKITDDLQAQLAKAVKDKEELRKFEPLREAEDEVRRALTDAMTEAAALRAQAQALMEQARSAAEGERLKAAERAKAVYEQADARLDQATRDAGRMIAEAEKKAREISGEAYDALRDKQLLEHAAEAIRNVIEGYGDRYLVPTHSLLDELAVEFGYTSAGESLKSAREQSRRMVQQGEAATCEYVEAGRRATAVRFVIDAFNGRVDAILTRVKHDNFGVLEQEIRDALSLVNLNGRAFREARILPAYLDARLAELKWAVVVQELARKQQEEQRDLRARLRDEEKARKEQEEKMRQAAKEEELKKKALEEKEGELAAARLALEHAAAEEKARLQARIEDMQSANEGLRRDLAAATERKLTIAQQTQRGHVYVISNVGAFGEGIYKIGQTRREPQVRVDELGDASVPFEFDIHALIESDNAPALEHRLHRRFLGSQVNKINSRKEFFRATLKDIREEVDKLKAGEDFTVKRWTDVAEATQYRESLDIEGDSDKLQKWLKRQEALSDRELRLDALRLSVADVTEDVAEVAGSDR